ncbi:MAG: DNA polymerase IV [Deltaproteobacteria bacterium]|jgi:DNA polymerase-4|nr:DNA polymerase IV [Deltaproteobacteria bacterium]
MDGRGHKGPVWIIHLDLDAFYASVEILDNPALKGLPVIIGGTGPRSVVSTCSYEARAKGVRSGMPSAEAHRLCPEGIFMGGRMWRYRELSAQVMGIFKRYTPLVEPLALDEAFLDVTASIRLFGPAPEIAERIRREVFAETGLTISAGVSTIKHVAKIASGFKKPNGLTVIEEGRELEFLRPLAIGKLWGVGKVTEKNLRALGITTVGQFADLPEDYVLSSFGQSGHHMWNLANGIDPREVEPSHEAKSLGNEETYAEDVSGPESVSRELLALAVKVAARLRAEKLAALTVTVKARDNKFNTHTRSKTLSRPVSDHGQLHRLALELFPSDKKGPWRLLGLSTSKFAPGGQEAAPMTLFEAAGLKTPQAKDKLSEAMDAINDRFGQGRLKPATLLDRPPGTHRADRPEKPGAQKGQRPDQTGPAETDGRKPRPKPGTRG